MTGVFKKNSKGKLKNGKYFKIIDFRNFTFSDSGEIHSGVIDVIISENEDGLDKGIYDTYCVSDIAKMIDYDHYNSK